MTIEFQPLSAPYAALLAGMHRICFAEPWDEVAMAGLLALPGTYGFLGVSGDQPRGFILCQSAADEAEVLTILVLPPYRRQGLGRDLLDRARSAAEEAGAVALFLEVAADNLAGQALYAAEGFDQVGRRPRYYSGRTDALILKRSLGNS